MVPRSHAVGRGRNYSWRRGRVEAALQRIYFADWPARAWGLTPWAGRVNVEHHRLALLPASLRGHSLRVVFASDLHIGPTTASRTLDLAFAKIAALRPDVLLLGGDYVFLAARQGRTDELEQRVRAVPAATKLAVLGNHDLWTEYPAIERALVRAGATVLVNAHAWLPSPFDAVAVVGLDDPWTGAPDADAALAGTEHAALRIGLCHAPEGALSLADRDVPIMLCGHTHGGQIALPGPRPIVLPPGPYSRRYPFGRHVVGDLQVIVSRGVGATELPIRAFAPADVVLLELVAPDAT
ncbi:MAG: metallophosphoesterase [Deltaproteobacteria bacterium]|nr:metallophosphoesterase [Nannocystaceae bacterium]